MQEIVVFMGQSRVFEDASEELKKLTGVEVTSKQVERLTHAYGELLEVGLGEEPQQIVPQTDELHYCMTDGGMILTREDDWKEMKLARIFSAKAHMAESDKRNFIRSSQYVAHLGGHSPFFKKLEVQTDPLKHMVWICDGAQWIWNRVSSAYPNSTKILDYFHCSEKLHLFAKEAIKEEEERQQWTKLQSELLLANQVKEVICHISLIDCKGKALESKRNLLTYYENNQDRMQYKTYKDRGLLIGSGPMEAAHRHVIQCRMKLSGQRWTIKGAQQVANLRVANKSGNWNRIVRLASLN
jgi:hypothetical protein